MPGRYLLIEFDDEAAATLLRAQINAATKKGKRFRVIGLFARPGTPCYCVPVAGDRSKNRYKRGSKLGWWLCTSCKRPRLGDHDLVNLIKPHEVESPATFDGVDAYALPMENREYIRNVPTLSVITLPARVASANQK